MIKIFILAALAGLAGFYSMFQSHDDLGESVKRGEDVYMTNCMSCHMMNGQGVPGVYPPLAGEDSLLRDININIDVILKGLKGEVMVNGQPYNTDMPSQEYLTDQQIADVLNYVRNTWENQAEIIMPEQVKALRDSL